MKLSIFFFLFSSIFGFLDAAKNYTKLIQQGGCPGPSPSAAGGMEINAAGIFPNDQVVLSEDGEFITSNTYGENGTEHSPYPLIFCPAYTCGRKTFPHGFGFEPNVKRMLMFCEEHRCVHPETIKCRKTTEKGACRGENEWVAGFVERKNGTENWLEVECCYSTVNTKPIFIENRTISGVYYHDYFVENGKLTGVDYFKTIESIFGGANFAISIYRMSCDLSFNDTDVPSIFDSPESLIDADGTGAFVNATKMCNQEKDIHVFGQAFSFRNPFENKLKRLCLKQNCLNEKNIVCTKNVKMEDCVEENQWVADIKLRENSTDNELDVECCQYNDTNSVKIEFVQIVNFTNPNIEADDKVSEFANFQSEHFINNITVDNSFENGTIYFGTMYSISCSRPPPEVNDYGHMLQSILFYMADTARRIQKAVLRNATFAAEINPKGAPSFQSIMEQQKSQNNDPIMNLLGGN